MEQTLCPVTSNVEVMPDVRLMWIEAPNIAGTVLPGQFITVRCRDFTLRRPLSVHQISSREIALLFKIAGKGTFWLSQRQTGESIDILGPLGKGFGIKQGAANLLLVAGGIGIAPLILLAQRASSQHQVILIHGASTAAQLSPSAMFNIGSSSPSKKRNQISPSLEGIQFIPVTEDGSMGKKGMATDILPDFLGWADQVYACGPVDMYRVMAEMPWPTRRSDSKLRKCQISLEVRMGCGFGACYGCTINTKKGLKQVCRDGPVFELDDIIWQEVSI
jgi:dihydroorotate dehydrogenase electron transfer subunit